MTFLAYSLIFLLIILIYSLIFRTLVIAVTSFSKVPFLPTPIRQLDSVLSVMKLQDGDRVLDIGSGDGRFLIYAGRKYPNVNFSGIELNFFLVTWTRLVCRILKLKNVEVFHGDALKFEYMGYDKVYMYLTPSFIDEVLKKVEEQLKHGASIYSFHFPMGYIFPTSHKIEEYPVKYCDKPYHIFKWTK